MKIRADLTQHAAVDTRSLDWQPSPAAGVERKMLDRDGAEVARATSLVRYAPGSAFPEHEHGGGEEFLVLEGTFCDERGEYGAGTYVRNPIGSTHRPSSPEGCTLFVKLRQMSDPREPRVVVDTERAAWQHGDSGPIEVQHLFDNAATGESVRLERLDAGARVQRDYPGGFEMLVLSGRLRDGRGVYDSGAWVRLPPGSSHELEALTDATVWVKTGHLG